MAEYGNRIMILLAVVQYLPVGGGIGSHIKLW